MDEEALKKLVGNKIKELRSIKHWSRIQVADKLEMSENNYGCIERGEIDVSLIRLAQLAETFNSFINLYGIYIPALIDSNTNEKNVYNLTGKGKNHKNFQGCTIGCSETETIILKHELEKAHLLLQERDKEIEHFKKQVSQLEEINRLKENK
jgi:transcriptional regulator with XRE-family HTH domain